MTEAFQVLTTSSQQLRTGCWTLGRGCALTLAPRRAGTLHLRRGRLWVTLDGPHRMGARASGDLVLHAGDRLCLRAGQRAVLEDWSRDGPEAPALDWRPAPADARAALWRVQWQRSVAQPGADAAAALGLLGRALAQLAAGLPRVVHALGLWAWHSRAAAGAGPLALQTPAQRRC